MRPLLSVARGVRFRPYLPYRRGRAAAGFSLTELLVVVAIALIVSAIGVPQVTEGMRRHRAQTSATMVAGKLTEARINALKRNHPTWLLVDAGARTVQVQTAGAGGAVNLGDPGMLSQGVTFVAAPAQVDYDSMGRTTAVQTIQVATGAVTRTVTVRLTGAATIN